MIQLSSIFLSINVISSSHEECYMVFIMKVTGLPNLLIKIQNPLYLVIFVRATVETSRGCSPISSTTWDPSTSPNTLSSVTT